MKTVEKLADYDHPLVIETAKRLTGGMVNDRQKLERIFYYVRDEIKFHFPKNGDLIKASDTIKSGKGQCNTKGTLFLALAKAAGIPTRIHFSLIEKAIQRGFFVGLMYKLIPDYLSHSWIEVNVEGKWRNIDSYINDKDLYLAGKKKLQEKGWKVGYSIACSNGESSMEFNIDEEKFVQMDAVIGDHGTWNDPSAYYASELYANRPNLVKLLFYRLTLGRVNRRVRRLRERFAGAN